MVDGLNYVAEHPVNFCQTLDYQFSPLRLFSQQKEMLDFLFRNKKTITILPRGASKSFTFALYALYRFITTPPTKIGLFSKSQRQANKLLDVDSDIINSTTIFAASRKKFLVDQKQRLKSHTYSEIVALPHDPFTILGEHPDVLLLDECQAYESDELYKKILKPMLTGVQTELQIPELHLAFVAEESEGFAYDMYANAGKFGFRILKKDWTQCEGYDPEEVERDRIEMGERYYLTQLMCEFIPATSSPFPFELIQKNIGEVTYNPDYPCIGGIDIGKKRDQSCLCIVQPLGEKVQVVDLFIGQYDYSLLAGKCKAFSEDYRVSSFLVDTTSGEEFVDFGRKPPYSLPLKPFSFSGGHKNALIDFLHIQMEQSNLIIPEPVSPETFRYQELISDLRHYRDFLHLPDSVAALALAVWNAKKLGTTVQSFGKTHRRSVGITGGRVSDYDSLPSQNRPGLRPKNHPLGKPGDPRL